MEPPQGVLASIWNFIRFLPYFTGLLLLGTIKGEFLSSFVYLLLLFDLRFLVFLVDVVTLNIVSVLVKDSFLY